MRFAFLKPSALLWILPSLLLSGCSDIAQGVTGAVLDHQNAKEDLRRCEIEGAPFGGLRQSLDSQDSTPGKTTKVLMVHGISDHVPGYSLRFQKKLYEKLGLNVMDSEVKTISLSAPNIAWEPGEEHTLGTLRISRHTNAENSRRLLFYELTWSPITARQKRTLDADSANNEGLGRASLNNSLKGFINSTVPDLLIYTGNGYPRITASVAQSVCWMLADGWDNLPDSGTHRCDTWPGSTFASLPANDHFFVTHSLGSRITIDTIHNFSALNKKRRNDPLRQRLENIVRDKDFSVFMLANQLPLLQMGRNGPERSGAIDIYCDGGAKTNERVMRKMNIVAFSDPNDILSYPVPLDFTMNRLDSRMCPSVTNVSLNIAAEQTLFDAASFANPLTAHNGYWEDGRVIDLIANGVDRNDMSPVIAQRCSWLEAKEIGDRETR
ncbi:MAG: hypothetical protein PHE27_08435 [Alphaproteobacteria bacterium]|nr:hypothetical protein [Alphaproteobacteria bacterium]